MTAEYYSWHHATDRRVYNGALCSDMQREQDSIKQLKKLLPDNAQCTYFPMEGKWCCSLKDFKGQMFYQIGWMTNLGDCLVAALEAIDTMSKEAA